MNSNLKSLANFGDFDEFCPLSLLLVFILIIFKYIIGSMQNSFTVHAINQQRLLANRVSTCILLEDIFFLNYNFYFFKCFMHYYISLYSSKCFYVLLCTQYYYSHYHNNDTIDGLCRFDHHDRCGLMDGSAQCAQCVLSIYFYENTMWCLYNNNKNNSYYYYCLKF